MLATFRNFAVVFVSWYVYDIASSLLAYTAQFAIRVPPGPLAMTLLIAVVPLLIVAFPAGMIVASAVKPRGARGWVMLFAALAVLAHVAREAIALRGADLGIDSYVAFGIVALLLAGSAIAGGEVIRRRAQLAIAP